MRRFSVARGLTAAPVLLVALSLCSAASAQDATAQDPARVAQVQKLSEEGATLYQAREFRRANEKFQQAYAVDPDPNLLYNIAKCYEALGDRAAAIEKYEAFLREPGADSHGKTRAQESLRVLKRGDTAEKPAAPRAAAEPQQRFVVPTVVAAGLGVAGLAVGTIFGVSALGKRSDLEATCPARSSCPPGVKEDITSLKTTSTISTIGFAAGGVGLVLAGVFYILGRPQPSERASVGFNAAGLAGTF